ncbi:carbohydrate sulfotransferase 8 [Aplochiton taeniatus]
MKLPGSVHCPLWLLLLLGAGWLLLLVNLQDASGGVQHQAPGAEFEASPQQPVGRELHMATVSDAHSDRDRRLDDVPSEPYFPGQPPAFQELQHSPSPVTDDPPPKRPSSAPAREEDQRAQSLAQTQESRQQLLSEVCAKYQPNAGKRPLAPSQVARVYVEDRWRLLYCEVPKAGCSNWKRVLMVLSGRARSTHLISHNVTHYANHLRQLDSYDPFARTQKLNSYNRVIFVREPFERLVSAYRDKFESPNPFYHSVYGRPIIKQYRANATLTAQRTGAGVTFREFVRYLVDIHRSIGMDIHWLPVSQLCIPCMLHYTFIGKFENMGEEANFLLQSIGAPKNLTFPNFKDRNPHEERTSFKITQRYFGQLSATQRQKVYDLYYMDYQMFNYPKPFEDLY